MSLRPDATQTEFLRQQEFAREQMRPSAHPPGDNAAQRTSAPIRHDNNEAPPAQPARRDNAARTMESQLKRSSLFLPKENTEQTSVDRLGTQNFDLINRQGLRHLDTENIRSADRYPRAPANIFAPTTSAQDASQAHFALVARLHNVEPAAVIAAHGILIAKGYRFLGYHGTNKAGMKSIVPTGLDPSRQGAEAGTMRGPGFYLAKNYALAQDYSKSATEQWVETNSQTRSGETRKREGDAGEAQVLRIYGKPEKLALSKTAALGIMNSGDEAPNNLEQWKKEVGGGLRKYEKKNADSDREEIKTEDQQHLEMVIHPKAYHALAAIPSLGKQEDRDAFDMHGRDDVRAWPSHTDDYQISGKPTEATPANNAPEEEEVPPANPPTTQSITTAASNNAATPAPSHQQAANASAPSKTDSETDLDNDAPERGLNFDSENESQEIANSDAENSDTLLPNLGFDESVQQEGMETRTS